MAPSASQVLYKKGYLSSSFRLIYKQYISIFSSTALHSPVNQPKHFPTHSTMVSSLFKITFLGAAAIALLSLSHVEAASSILTPEQIEARGNEYAARVLHPTKTYYKCRSECYNDALRSTLGKNFWGIISPKDKARYAAEVALVDICVAKEIHGFTSFDKIEEYENKRRLHEITVSQYCVDEEINKGKGVFDEGIAKVPAFRVPEVQTKLLACSLDRCDPQYIYALKIASEGQ